MGDVIHILIVYHTAFEKGLLLTLLLALIAWTFGICLGTLIGIYGHNDQVVGRGIRNLNFFTQSIPVIIALFWFHYPLQEILNVSIPPFITAAVILAAVNTISVAQTIKNALDKFPTQYSTVGIVCGLTPEEITRKIKVPIVFRAVISEVLTLQIYVLQMTIFASLISVEELFRVAQQINSQIYKPVEIYTGLALFFIIMCLPLVIMAHRLKTKFVRDYSEK